MQLVFLRIYHTIPSYWVPPKHFKKQQNKVILQISGIHIMTEKKQWYENGCRMPGKLFLKINAKMFHLKELT